MPATIVFITHNRLEYTVRAMDSLLRDMDSDYELMIWDNFSTDGTKDYLLSLRDPRIVEVHFADKNYGALLALNHCWSRAKREFLGKVDNDCLVTGGWVKRLMEIHRDVQEAGALACWHFREEDFNIVHAGWKIREFGRQRIFVHPWVCGTGFIMKRSCFDHVKLGSTESVDAGLTSYFIKLSLAGYVNGWPYPLILQEHMDDPLSPHCLYSDDESLRALADVTVALRSRRIRDMHERLELRRRIIENLHFGPPDGAAYIGLRGRLRRVWPGIDRFMYRLRNYHLRYFFM